MTTTSRVAHVLTSCAVFFVTTELFAQETPTEKRKGNTMEMDMSKCPVMGDLRSPEARHTAAGAMSNRDWWPNQLNLGILHQNSPKSNPLGPDFNYAAEFRKLALDALKKDLQDSMTTSH